MKISQKDIARFESKFIPEPTSGCWLWIGTITAKGYGFFKMTGKQRQAHRLSFIIHKNTDIESLQVNHKCNNKCCVNPDHLYAGTHRDNMRDVARCGIFKGRNHPKAKLSDDDIRVIRTRYDNGETPTRISKDYPVHQSTVGKIGRRKSWSHVK